MKETTIDQTLVLCDLDSLLLDAGGNMPKLRGTCCSFLPAGAAG